MQFKLALGALDSFCQEGIWISNRLVFKLGLQNMISDGLPSQTLRDGGGGLVTSSGSITLSWKWIRGTSLHENNFLLLPHTHQFDRFDVIFGSQYCHENQHLKVNEGSFLPLTSHTNLTPGQYFFCYLQKDH